MLDKRIDSTLIVRSYGCDNCKHENDGKWDDYCRICNPDITPPSKYRPAKRTIQAKFYYEKSITYEEYLSLLKIRK